MSFTCTRDSRDSRDSTTQEPVPVPVHPGDCSRFTTSFRPSLRTWKMCPSRIQNRSAAGAACGESALLKMGCVMGRQLRRWTRPCPASRGIPSLLLSRGPSCLGPYSGIFQKDQNKESAPGAPWVKGPDLLGQCRLIEYIRAGSPVIQESI